MVGLPLSHDEFFDKLGELLTAGKGKDHGSVFLTQKRVTHGGNEAQADLATPNAANFPILIRATNGKSGEARKAGKRVKLSTIVDPDALDVFYARYAELCKAGMAALKPRDRSKRKTKGKKKKGSAVA